jgi:hypothetical protein
MNRARWTVFAFLVAMASCTAAEPDMVPNVRLGMAPRDVRDRFKPGGDGTWQTALGKGDDTVLEWTGTDPKARLSRARFEFHNGMLVAIRARAPEPSARELVSATKMTVSVRAPAPEGGTNVTVLARDCPTHHDEAEGLASRAR